MIASSIHRLSGHGQPLDSPVIDNIALQLPQAEHSSMTHKSPHKMPALYTKMQTNGINKIVGMTHECRSVRGNKLEDPIILGSYQV